MFVLGIGEAGKNMASQVGQISNLKAVCVDTDSGVPKKAITHRNTRNLDPL